MSSPSTVGVTDVTTPTGTATDRLPYGVMAVCGTAIAFAGYGAVATQTLINGWVTRSYPATARTTGVGWSLGIGRIGGIVGPSVTGAIVSATGGGTAAFLLFAAVGVIGALLAAAVNQRQ